MMKKNIISIVFYLLTLQVTAQNFQNGDLEGIITGVSNLPNNWQNVPLGDPNCLAAQPGNDTPDLTSLSEPSLVVGFNGNPFNGDTFVSGAFASYTPNFSQEGIMQMLNGLTIGQKFLIHFRQTVVKNNSSLDKSGSWAVYIDTTLAGITATTYSNEPYSSINLPWEVRSVIFTASATSHLIKFLPMDDDTNYTVSTTDTTGALYMGIDSIGLDLITSLPNPSQLGTFEMFPNPNNGSFVMQYSGILNNTITLSITDVYGKLIGNIAVVNTTTKYENTSLSNGLYFYSLRNKDDELQRGKILIVK